MYKTSFLMITDKSLNEMPFRDVTEITTLDNEQNNEVNSQVEFGNPEVYNTEREKHC